MRVSEGWYVGPMERKTYKCVKRFHCALARLFSDTHIGRHTPLLLLLIEGWGCTWGSGWRLCPNTDTQSFLTNCHHLSLTLICAYTEGIINENTQALYQ